MKYILLPILFIVNFTISSECIKIDLTTAQNLAIINNLDIVTEKLNYNLNKRSYFMGFTKYLPQFNTSFSLGNMLFYTYDTEKLQYYKDPYDYRFVIGADQIIFDGGDFITSTYFKYYEINLTGKELEEKEALARMEIETLYGQIVFLNKKVIEQKKNIEFLEADMKIMQKNLELELITELDLKEIKLNKIEAEINLSQDITKYEYALIGLKRLINIDSDIELTYIPEIKSFVIDKEAEEYFKRKTLMNTSKSNSLKLNEYKTRAQQVATYMSLLPQLTMNFSYTFEKDPDDESKTFNLKKKSWAFTFNMTWKLPGFPVNFKPAIKFPLDNKKYQDTIDKNNELLGENRSDVDVKYLNEIDSINKFEKANIDMYKAHLQNDKFIKDVDRDINKLIKEYNETIRVYNLSSDRTKLLEDKHVILQLKYKLGEARYLDITENENKLMSSKINLIDISNQIYNKIIEIKKLTGLDTYEFYEAISQ